MRIDWRRQALARRSAPLRQGLLVSGLLGVLLALSIPLAAQTTTRPSRGAVLPIRGVIDDIMRDSLERRIADARADGATTIIFEMDTPGGAVTSALSICRLIKNLPPEIHTVAWVHPEAYSAGAMISVACREIWMSPSSSIGDCAPIMVTPVGGVTELGDAERAKAESPILQEFRDSAVRNGYDQLLSRAMVAVGEEVWWLENVSDPGQRRFVTPAEKTKLIDDVAADERAWKLVESYTDTMTGKVITVTQPVDRANELLTMSQYDAVAFGFARGIASSLDDLSQKLGLAATPKVYEKTGWEGFAMWLNSPLIRGILLVIVMIGAYMEFQSPGLILPGVTALIALVVFLAAPYAAGLASIWTIIVFVIGAVLLAVEIFVIPGFGIAGILGILLIVVALLASFVPAEPEAPTFSLPSLQGTWDGLITGLKVLIGSIVISMVGMVLVARYLPRSRMVAGVISANPQGTTMALSDAHPDVAQVGDVGVVTGDLRPGGQARFGQEVVDVQSQGEYIEAGRRVQVIRRAGMTIVVEPLPHDGTA